MFFSSMSSISRLTVQLTATLRGVSRSMPARPLGLGHSSLKEILRDPTRWIPGAVGFMLATGSLGAVMALESCGFGDGKPRPRDRTRVTGELQLDLRLHGTIGAMREGGPSRPPREHPCADLRP